MASAINWDNLPSSKKNSSDGNGKRELNFIKFTNDSVHTIRPVGKAVWFYRFYYKPIRKYFIANVDPDTGESNLEELKEILGCDPEQRFAMNVIDRSDKKIKILQGPMTMLEQFAEVAQATGRKPGSKEGGDWRITSKGAGKSRRYNCNYLGSVPFTEEELEKIKNKDESKNEWYILEKVFKPSDMEYVQKMVNPESETNETNDSVDSDIDDDIDF